MVVYDDLYIHGLAAEDQLRGVDPRDICIISTDRPGDTIQNSTVIVNSTGSAVQNSIGIGNGPGGDILRLCGLRDTSEIRHIVRHNGLGSTVRGIRCPGGIRSFSGQQ